MLLKGKDVAAVVKSETARLAAQSAARGRKPCLAIFRVGENEPDLAYENRVRKNASELGIDVQTFAFGADVPQEAFLAEVQRIGADGAVDGILIFRPLPAQLEEDEVAAAVNADKDADCMNPVQLQRLLAGDSGGTLPCTPEAVMEILKYYQIPVAGKRVAIVNRSLVLGKPLALLFLQENATVTVCHSRTVDLASVTREADIVVTGVGRPRFFGAEYFKKDAVVIDVGINSADGKLCGDVDFENVERHVAAITPVPGGVGAVTSAVLLRHVVWRCGTHRSTIQRGYRA